MPDISAGVGQSGPSGPDTADFPDDATIQEQDQPIEIRLKWDTELHRKIISKLQARLRLAYQHINPRYDDWDRVDEHLRMYVDMSRQARKGNKTADPTKKEMPFDRGIVIPASYAIAEVRKTQLVGLFSARDPMLDVDGRGPEDMKPAKIMEAVLGYDCDQTNALAVIYAFLQDADKYGQGAIYDAWESQPGWISKPPLINSVPPEMQQQALEMLPFLGEPRREFGLVKEFNRLMPVDQFNFWPDPRVSRANIQEGEFVGHRLYRGMSYLLERRVERKGVYFNIDHLKDVGGSAGQERNSGGGLGGGIGRTRFSTDSFSMKESADEKDRGSFALDHFHVKIIPKDWQLGPEDDPQIWQFTMADERTITRAHAQPNDHGQYPYSVAEINHDPHCISNPGMIENLDGIQRTINWLWNSHIENTRKALNDSMIFSAMHLEAMDVLNPGPARWIRLTQRGEALVEAGMDINHFYSQLQVEDLTAGHLNTGQALFDWAQRMSAANDPAMGQPTEEKRTLGEVQSIIAAASQRLSVVARLIDAMAIRPMAERMISNRQQFTELEQYYRVAGDLAKEGEQDAVNGPMGRLLVNKQQLQGNFDYTPHSAMLPADPARSAELWLNIAQTAMNYGQFLFQGTPSDPRILDIRSVLNEAFRAGGARNIDQFYTMPPPPPPAVMPDQAVEAGVQAGNLVPMQQGAQPQ